MKMQVGRKYVVHAHVDEESYRIVASAKVERYLSKEKPEYAPEEVVSILIWQKTDLGFKAIIDDKYSGLLYENEIFCPLETGMEMKAFVKQVREDGKVDLILQKPGFEKIDDFSKTLLDYIQASCILTITPSEVARASTSIMSTPASMAYLTASTELPGIPFWIPFKVLLRCAQVHIFKLVFSDNCFKSAFRSLPHRV